LEVEEEKDGQEEEKEEVPKKEGKELNRLILARTSIKYLLGKPYLWAKQLLVELTDLFLLDPAKQKGCYLAMASQKSCCEQFPSLKRP